jgi:prepilin-type N-terminal cleavage/methylation domain-containing protein
MNMNQKLPIADCRFRIDRRFGGAASPLAAGGAHGATHPTHSSVNSDKSRARDGSRCRKSQIVNIRAFTLVELLIVIGIIAALAALIFPVAGAVKRRAFIQTARAEMSQVETAIERYKSAYGFYPPCNTNNVLINPLYYE